MMPDAAVLFPACYVDIDPLGGAVQRRLYKPTHQEVFQSSSSVLIPFAILTPFLGWGGSLHIRPSCELDFSSAVGRDTYPKQVPA